MSALVEIGLESELRKIAEARRVDSGVASIQQAMNRRWDTDFTQHQDNAVERGTFIEKEANVALVKAYMAKGLSLEAAVRKAYPKWSDARVKALVARLKGGKTKTAKDRSEEVYGHTEKKASADMTKVARIYGRLTCSPYGVGETWVERFSGTPFYKEAMAIQRDRSQVEVERAKLEASQLQARVAEIENEAKVAQLEGDLLDWKLKNAGEDGRRKTAEKLAHVHDGKYEWSDCFRDSPFYKQAMAIERDNAQIEVQRAKRRVEDQLMWARDNEFSVKQAELEARLADWKYKNAGGTEKTAGLPSALRQPPALSKRYGEEYTRLLLKKHQAGQEASRQISEAGKLRLGKSEGQKARELLQIHTAPGAPMLSRKYQELLPGHLFATPERRLIALRAALRGKVKTSAQRDMPSFTAQDRPEKVKAIYRALKREHPDMPAEMKARIAARQGKPGKQKQGPPYKAPIKPWQEKKSSAQFQNVLRALSSSEVEKQAQHVQEGWTPMGKRLQHESRGDILRAARGLRESASPPGMVAAPKPGKLAAYFSGLLARGPRTVIPGLAR